MKRERAFNRRTFIGILSKGGFNEADLLLLGVAVIWGVNFSVVKMALSEMPPLSFNGLRFILASFAILILLRAIESDVKVDKSDLLRFLMLGVLGHALFQILFIWGINYTKAGSTALILSTSPIFTAATSSALGYERVSKYSWLGVVLSFLGVMFIIRESDVALSHSPNPSNELLGSFLILGSAVCWALYTALAKPLMAKYSPLKVTALTMAIGTVFLIPVVSKPMLYQDWSGLSLRVWIVLIYSFSLALVASYFIWYYAVKRIGSTRTSVYQSLTPIFSLIAARVLLGEGITIYQKAGLATILLAIYLTKIDQISMATKGQ